MMSTQKSFLINGSNGGLGVELTKRILADGNKVVGLGRSDPEEINVTRHPNFSFYKLSSFTEAFTGCFEIWILIKLK